MRSYNQHIICPRMYEAGQLFYAQPMVGLKTASRKARVSRYGGEMDSTRVRQPPRHRTLSSACCLLLGRELISKAEESSFHSMSPY